MATALGNVVVLDLTERFWGSTAAALLADFGAQVIRVEQSGAVPAPSPDAEGKPNDWNYLNDFSNRNKKCIAVDLASDAGRDVVQQLSGKVDAVITDWQLDRLEALALDYASVSARRADTVYGRGSGFGPKGADKDLPAIDELAAARTGMMPVLPQPGQPPLYAGNGQMYTSVMLAYGIVTALFHRKRTGEGQQVDASLLAGNMYGASLDLQAYLAIRGERMLEPVSRLDAGNPMSGVLYPTEDGLWIALTMPDTDRWWPQFSEVVGLDENDDRFNSHDKRTGANRLELIAALDVSFKKKPASEWRKIFTDLQMSADVIEDYEYPAKDDAARHNRYVLDLEDGSLGMTRMLGFPIFMSDTPARLRSTAPRNGQHSAEVLSDLLGYDEARIVAMQQQGVIL
jgi:formyl-CoA transferase